MSLNCISSVLLSFSLAALLGCDKSDNKECTEGQSKDAETQECTATTTLATGGGGGGGVQATPAAEESGPYKLPGFLSASLKEEDSLNGLYTIESVKTGTCEDEGTAVDYLGAPGATARIQLMKNENSVTGVTLWALLCDIEGEPCGQWQQYIYDTKTDADSWDNSSMKNPPGQYDGTSDACVIRVQNHTVKKVGDNIIIEERFLASVGGIQLEAGDGDCGDGSQQADLISKYRDQLTECSLLTRTVLVPKP